jgi:hypothetical protein
MKITKKVREQVLADIRREDWLKDCRKIVHAARKQLEYEYDAGGVSHSGTKEYKAVSDMFRDMTKFLKDTGSE